MKKAEKCRVLAKMEVIFRGTPREIQLCYFSERNIKWAVKAINPSGEQVDRYEDFKEAKKEFERLRPNPRPSPAPKRQFVVVDYLSAYLRQLRYMNGTFLSAEPEEHSKAVTFLHLLISMYNDPSYQTLENIQKFIADHDSFVIATKLRDARYAFPYHDKV
jgi:hypothetical protein